ncbi:MAG: aquaporin family protein [Saprospiraceae bacterium]|nr:aquaporin family protein [Saprospiraceae bacterium]
MEIFLSEFFGSFILLLLGAGVVANVILKGTKGNSSGWIVICLGWGMAVFLGVIVSSKSGSHINPAVSLAMLLLGKLTATDFFIYVLAQISGAFLGASMVWLMHKDHFEATDSEGIKLAVFSTGPEIRNIPLNLLSEVLGTFALISAVLFIPAASDENGALNALPIALVVVGIGLSLGGTTGWAINPARDLGPRIAHALLPIKAKGTSDWPYSWVPIVGPLTGSALAVLVFHILA